MKGFSRRKGEATPTPPAHSPALFPLISCSGCDEGGHVTFGCLASGFFPLPAQLTWGGVASSQAKNFPEVRTGSGSYGLSSRVTMGVAEAEGGNFRCQVQHRGSNYGLDIPGEGRGHTGTSAPPRISPSPYARPSPSVTVLPPSLQDLYLSEHPNLTCVASNLKSPDPKFTWSRSSGAAVGVATSGPARRLPNGQWEVSSVLGICAEDWNSGDVFTCRVGVAELGDTPLVGSAQKENGERPFWVFVFPPPPEELAASETATLTCLASGFFPRDVLVTWTQQDAPVHPGRFSILGPAPDAGSSGRFSVYSKMAVPADEWRRGDVFTCVVGHDGIEMRFVQRSLDKMAARPANVNVSVVLADSDTVCY
uniref:Ig-like domain-containing protein n=1 Tax=Cyanoderma ruficeps TaxID=181631 RepID=A0A8C3R204_9PASS